MVLNEWYSCLIPEDMTFAVPSQSCGQNLGEWQSIHTYTHRELQVPPISTPQSLVFWSPCSVSPLSLPADHLHLVPPTADEVYWAWSFTSIVDQGWLLLLEWQGAQTALCSTASNSCSLSSSCHYWWGTSIFGPSWGSYWLSDAFFLRLHNAFLKSCCLGNSGSWRL